MYNFGYNAHIEEALRKEEDYILGGVSKLPQEVLCPERNWTPFLPKLEIQNKGIETFWCTSFSNCNVRETMHKRRYGEEIDNSDRFSAQISGTIIGSGNSHNAVAENTRKKWYVKEELFPFTAQMTIEELKTAPPQELLDLALKEKIMYEYGYERVDLKDLYDAELYSPCVGAVDSRTAITSEFRAYDHSIMIYGFDPVKEKWLVFDSYFGRVVEYDVDYPFGYIMRFHYKKIETLVVQEEDLKNTYLANFIQWLKRNSVIVVTI